jgi:CheY-like chemotaxis protein
VRNAATLLAWPFLQLFLGVSNATAQRRAAPSNGPSTGARRRVVRERATPALVLIVDDSDDTREMYGEFLEHEGLRVIHAVDGDQALWKVIALKPDVVVMDLAMPILDGWNATTQIKARPNTAHIPVIVLTGHVTPEALTRAVDADADAVLAKPCTPKTLFAIVRQLLTR